MLIPKSYFLEEGKEAPEGTVIKTCRICQSKYALPKEVADQVTNDVCDDDDCKNKLDKEIGAAAAAMLKDPKEAADTIKAALGK